MTKHTKSQTRWKKRCFAKKAKTSGELSKIPHWDKDSLRAQIAADVEELRKKQAGA